MSKTTYKNRKRFFKLRDLTPLTEGGLSRNKRSLTHNHCVPGVYFWGITLRDDKKSPNSHREFLICYVGKSKTNVIQRMMEEFSQLLFGGYGVIFNPIYLKDRKNNLSAKLTTHKRNKENGTDLTTDHVVYLPDSMADLNRFNNNPDKLLKDSIQFMKDRLIFTWVSCSPNDVDALEWELHHMIGENILGLGSSYHGKTGRFKPGKSSPVFNKNKKNISKKLVTWIERVS